MDSAKNKPKQNKTNKKPTRLLVIITAPSEEAI